MQENENETAATADAPEQETAGQTESSTAGENTGATDTTDNAETSEQTETAAAPEAPEEAEDISYHAVQKDGVVTAIWEMQGRRHIRTIDPRSREGIEILRLFTAEHEDHHEEAAA
jgi:hypothetical protein